MTRSQPLSRYRPLRRTRLRKVSLRRRKGMVDRQWCREVTLSRADGVCEFPLVCHEPATDVHELVCRSQGGDPHDPRQTAASCRLHHIYAHEQPEKAHRLGWLYSKKYEGGVPDVDRLRDKVFNRKAVEL